jgi:hypothetical protein
MALNLLVILPNGWRKKWATIKDILTTKGKWMVQVLSFPNTVFSFSGTKPMVRNKVKLHGSTHTVSSEKATSKIMNQLGF